MRLALQDGRAADERWHLRKGGARFWASGEITPLRDETGGHLGFVKIVRDRTREHEAAEALRASEAALAADREVLARIFEQAPTFMGILRGPEHRIERVNPGYVRLVGGRDTVDRTVAEVLPDAAAETAWPASPGTRAKASRRAPHG